MASIAKPCLLCGYFSLTILFLFVVKPCLHFIKVNMQLKHYVIDCRNECERSYLTFFIIVLVDLFLSLDANM